MSPSDPARQNAGKMAFHAGLAAEEAVERHYNRAGYATLARRWRGAGGELDLVFEQSDGFVFVEVKKSNSAAAAALRVSPTQKRRIFAAGLEFVASRPMGQLSHMRFDVALVDAAGGIQIIDNALEAD
jgi:putative endonuclease